MAQLAQILPSWKLCISVDIIVTHYPCVAYLLNQFSELEYLEEFSNYMSKFLEVSTFIFKLKDPSVIDKIKQMYSNKDKKEYILCH